MNHPDRNHPKKPHHSVYSALIPIMMGLLASPSPAVDMEVPILPVGPHRAHYREELLEVQKRQDAVEKLANTYHLPLVHYQKAFDDACQKAPAECWSWDGCIPPMRAMD